LAERDALRQVYNRVNPGHFYSPIPSMENLYRNEARIFDRSLRQLPGVDLNVEGQLKLLDELKRFCGEHPWDEEPSVRLRYFFNNEYFRHADAILLYCMIRFAQPKRLIEIGSGFSSFLALDTNERFFGGRIRLTFIDPHDERFRSRLKPGDLEAVELISIPLQDVELARFSELSAGDILFVDSSHVSKVDSDVNRILFEILPRLPVGVFVHFHDVFYPFEYPKEWFKINRYWNEAYMLRAFLAHNSVFKICIWNHFIGTFYGEKLKECMPMCINDIGASLWLQRV